MVSRRWSDADRCAIRCPWRNCAADSNGLDLIPPDSLRLVLLSHYFETLESEPLPRQERQIVQSCA